MSVMLVYVTAGSAEEAQRIARTVVAERLAACANIFDGTKSIYWWEGRVQEAYEAVLFLKTSAARVEALTTRLCALHSYDCPCIEAIAVSGGNTAFLEWVERETEAADKMKDDGIVTIDRLDHLVLTVRDIEATRRFYTRILGMRVVEQDGRVALHFGRNKVNLHQVGHEFLPRAAQALPGTGDFCLITATPLEQVARHLAQCGVTVELGPVPRQGALGAMRSVYFRDPDDNLVEVANYL